MKKIFFISVFLIFTINIFSQITYDEYAKDGSRKIVTDYKIFELNLLKHAIGVGLVDVIGVNESDNFFLQIYVRGKKKNVVTDYEKGRKLLIKMDDQTIMDLESESSTIIPWTGAAVAVLYPISEDNLNTLLNGTVIKMRIENDINYIDCEIDDNKFVKNLKKVYSTLIEARDSRKKSEDKGIYNDF